MTREVHGTSRGSWKVCVRCDVLHGAVFPSGLGLIGLPIHVPCSHKRARLLLVRREGCILARHVAQLGPHVDRSASI